MHRHIHMHVHTHICAHTRSYVGLRAIVFLTRDMPLMMLLVPRAMRRCCGQCSPGLQVLGRARANSPASQVIRAGITKEGGWLQQEQQRAQPQRSPQLQTSSSPGSHWEAAIPASPPGRALLFQAPAARVWRRDLFCWLSEIPPAPRSASCLHGFWQSPSAACATG